MDDTTLELKLYSPITGHLMEDGWDEDEFGAAVYADYEGAPLSSSEMAQFEDVVQYADGYGEGVERRERRTEYGDLIAADGKQARQFEYPRFQRTCTTDAHCI